MQTILFLVYDRIHRRSLAGHCSRSRTGFFCHNTDHRLLRRGVTRLFDLLHHHAAQDHETD